MVSSYFSQSAFAGYSSFLTGNGGLFSASQFGFKSSYGASTYLPTSGSYFPGVYGMGQSFSSFGSAASYNWGTPQPAPAQSGLSQYMPMMMALLSRRNSSSSYPSYSPPRTYAPPASVSYVTTPQGSVTNTMQGGRGNNTFVQANQNNATNYINGHNRRDRVTSNNNNSTNIISTYGGRDRVYATGNANTNVINTGTGKDLVTQAGTNNSSNIYTGNGKDVVQLTGNNNNVKANLGAGRDLIRVGGTNGTYTINGGTGRDTAVLAGQASNWANTGNIWTNANRNLHVTLNSIEKIKFNPKLK